MSQHASPISWRVGIAIFAVVILLDLPRGIGSSSFVAAFAIGVVFWAAVYIAIYVAEQYLYAKGLLPPPVVYEELETISSEPEQDHLYLTSQKLEKLLKRLGEAVFSRGMTTVSKRQLETFKIVDSRMDQEADDLLSFLLALNLLDDLGNSTYQVTDRLKSYLKRWYTGDSNVSQPVRLRTQEAAR